jgi:tetratricopeptide (TPR) repeat protein
MVTSMSARLETLKSMLTHDPANAFARYGLAMELLNLGQAEESVAEFRTLLAAAPDYTYGYFHGGRALETLGRVDEARALYEAGLEASRKKGDAKALGEIQAALDILG